MTRGRLFANLELKLEIILVAVVTVLALAPPAGGQVRLNVPEESLGGPYYARLERGVVLKDDGWVAIAFYRDPACVRPEFNLLNFFDGANIPGIFFCSLTVNGFELWDDPAGAAPKQGKLRGNGAVPIWFVSSGDFQAALPGITLTELLAMPSLMKGVANQFEEVLHPIEGAEQNSLQIVAAGDLPDGRTFQFAAVEAAGELRFVRIVFR